jgi:nicotinic acid mononucleotide adenylyltransferase
MEDFNQRQKICLNPVNEQRNLLKAKPKDRSEIKNKKFMIINGQDSIAALDQRVWGRNVSCFGEVGRVYCEGPGPQSTHSNIQVLQLNKHLNHAQPTWGNQIVSGKNI